jgi:hypothetical protein
MGHGAPAQLGVTIRRARLKDKTMSSILPSLLMSSLTVRAKDVEAPLFLRAFGVPSRAPARAFGRGTAHGRKPGGSSGPPPLSRLLAAKPVDLRVPGWIPIHSYKIRDGQAISALRSRTDPRSCTAATKFFSKGNLGYLILGSLLVVYVALCTRWRDSLWGADAWEHHRAIIALTEDLWQPGNPTYATRDPSIRYSPYTVVQAAICRMTGLSPYDILSGAAVVNTLLLVVGLWGLLQEFGETPSAAAALIVMVGLYGGAPGYANSYALADLPWHQVNPSAFGFALTPFLWVLFRRTPCAGRTSPALLVVSVLGAVVMLDHPMTGFFALLGLLVIALTVPPDRYRRSMVNLSVVVGGVAILCMGWPWYNFVKAPSHARTTTIGLYSARPDLAQIVVSRAWA